MTTNYHESIVGQDDARPPLRTSTIAFLFLPGADFDDAGFLETCSKNKGMSVDIFSDFEDAIHWFFSTEDAVHESSGIKPDPIDTGQINVRHLSETTKRQT